MAEGSGVRWVLLVGLGLVLLAIVGALIYGRTAGSAVPSLAAPVAVSSATARQALAPAVELAMQWQADARLAAVSGRWSAVGRQTGGQAEWAFQFFSPSAQRLALIAVAGGTARMVRESLSPYTVPTFSAEEWRVDSDRALQAWWGRGGASLVTRRPDTDLAMQLRVPEEGSRQPVWTVVGFIADAEIAFTVVVDATNGVVVEP